MTSSKKRSSRKFGPWKTDGFAYHPLNSDGYRMDGHYVVEMTDGSQREIALVPVHHEQFEAAAENARLIAAAPELLAACDAVCEQRDCCCNDDPHYTCSVCQCIAAFNKALGREA